MHDNTAGDISASRPDDALGLAVQAALVGTVFMLAISGAAAIVFSLSAAM